jgi:hypothetical protein
MKPEQVQAAISQGGITVAVGLLPMLKGTKAEVIKESPDPLL